MISLDNLNRILTALLGSKQLANQWWVTKNKAFDMKTPLDVYIDDPDKVEAYLLNQLDPGGS